MNENEIKTNFTPQQKDRIGHYFFWVTIAIEAVLMVLIGTIGIYLYHHPEQILVALAISLVILWIGILIAYYAWAIYFYNINFGITDKDWDEIEEKRNTENQLVEPDKNPNSEETFGLPPGTVRGTIALTLLIGAMAMALVSFGKNSMIKENEVFIDSFDFIKTAFLMMIAFYFGQKSLEYLLPIKKEAKKADVPEVSKTTTIANAEKNLAEEKQTNTQTDVTNKFYKDGAQG